MTEFVKVCEFLKPNDDNIEGIIMESFKDCK